MDDFMEYHGYRLWEEDGWWIVDYPYDGEFGGELEFETIAEAKEFIECVASGGHPFG